MPIQNIFSESQKLRFLRSLLLGLGLAITPTLILAEDTDVYAPPIDPNFKPSVMFLIDSSESMRFSGETWKPWRFDRLKNPLIDFMRTSGDLNVGLSSFNGNDRGGAIIAPVANLDEDLCPDASCDEITLRSQIQRDSDDAFEWLDSGAVSAFSGATIYGMWANNFGSAGWYLSQPNETVVETADLNMVEAELLPLFVTQEGDKTIVGLRWPEISIGADYRVYNAYIRFGWPGDEFLDVSIGEGLDDIKATISIDNRLNSPPFADITGQRVSDRPYLIDTKPWSFARNPSWDLEIDAEKAVNTSSFHEIFNQVFTPGTAYSGPMTIKLELEPGELADRFNAINLLGVHTRGAQLPKPRFVYSYERLNLVPRPRLSVHRFNRLNIPRGATITKAHMETDTWHNPREFDPANLRIRAEDIGNSLPLNQTNSNLSERTPTDAAEPWNPPRFYLDYSRKHTPNIASLIQEVVNRDDWCSGNALSLLIDGTGSRYAYNHEAGKLKSASIHVSYDPKTVDTSDNCRALVGKGALALQANDSVIEDTDGTLHDGSTTYNSSGATRWLGLQFDDTQLSPGDVISEAHLSLTSLSRSIGRVTFETVVANSSFNEGFDVAGVQSKMTGAPSSRWYTNPLNEGDRVESTNIAPLIQAAINSTDWTRDSTLWIGLRRVGGIQAEFVTSHGASGEGPSLSIIKQVTGSEAASIPLRTVRDEIIEKIETLPATGNTPLVDAFLETAMYMHGKDVLHGRQRGEKISSNNVHRLSNAASYTGVEPFRPMECTEVDSDDAACVTEAIIGAAEYIAPDSSECRPNQIILVTDGDPTPSTAKETTSTEIKSITGISECDASPASQECAVDLARYLSSEETDHHPIKISTIGFEFQSGFLNALAAAGDGKFHSVANSGQMSGALTSISNNLEHDIATTVAPVAAVSQYNRATHRDDLYFALFAPTYGDSLWRGNVKRYGLGVLPGTEKIGVIDANGNAALDQEIDSISTSARSFWSTTADGSDVTKGGTAEQLVTNRNVVTWPYPSEHDEQGSRELVAFNIDNDDVTAADLNVAATERDNVINWMRGIDILDENDNSNVEEARKSMGAAMHTTPVVLNYGTTESPGDSIVFAGTHEGFLHAIDSSSGEELFAFLPHELYNNVGQFYTKQQTRMLHGIDGPISVWGDDKNSDGMIDRFSGEKAWVTFGMRRGGKHYYSIEVTDPNNPVLAWSIDSTKSGFSDLQQTWSKPKHARIKRNESATGELRDVLIFGNGYNTVNDAVVRDHEITHIDSGAVFIVDALTGELIHSIDSSDHTDMIWSIPSDIASIDLDFDGATDLLLFGDLGGNLWRVDMNSATDSEGLVSTSSPTVTLTAELADRSTGASSDSNANLIGDRRFFNTPDVAYMQAPDGRTYLGVVIGSGRRDHPLGTDAVNRLYSLHLDPNVPVTTSIEEVDLFDATETAAVLTDSHKGWFIDLIHSGEKMLGTPVIFNSRVLATTYVPQDTAGSVCEPKIGTGRLYVMDAFTAEGLLEETVEHEVDENDRSRELESGGIPPPISILVSDEDVDKPVALVGMESVEGVTQAPQRVNTYWSEY